LECNAERERCSMSRSGEPLKIFWRLSERS
jgi:hypothetical protein